MPTVNGQIWRLSRARMDLSSDQAAQLLGIAGGSLRQIETGSKPASLALACRAERIYKVPLDELLDGWSTDKKKPKKEPVAPKKRTNGHGNKAPGRKGKAS